MLRSKRLKRVCRAERVPWQRRMVPLEYIAFEHNNAAAELVKLAYDTPPLAFVHSYGCQQNVNDGERIKGVLMDIGYGLCDKPEDADLILFNTCAVREHAEQRVFGNVGALKGLKEKKRGLIIGLCGCMANQKHVVEKLRQSYPYVDLVFGVDGIDTLPQLIAQKLQKHKRVLLEPAQRPVIVENIPIRRESEFRAWLPIMYGCDNFCTYCIVPYVRGREKSRKPGDILAEFKRPCRGRLQGDHPAGPERQQLRQGPGRAGGLLRPAQPALHRARATTTSAS